MKEWREYEIILEPSDDTEVLIAEGIEVVQTLYKETDFQFFWSSYFGGGKTGYHTLRWGVKNGDNITKKLGALLPDKTIIPYDASSEGWTEDDDFYNEISEMKADACQVAVRMFQFKKPYDWRGMSMFMHFLFNSLGYTYWEEALMCARNTYECLKEKGLN